MESTVRALAISFLIISSAVAEPEPPPAPTPAPTPAALSPAIPGIVESPLPDGVPQQQTATVLLPEPNFLPPAKLSPGNDSPLGDAPDGSKPQPEDESRFQKLKSAAMGSARAGHLLKEAQTALSQEARKNFMRAYYYTICAQMRRSDPSLKLMIQNYETEEIQRLASENRSHDIKKKTAHSKNDSDSRLASAKRRHRYSKD